MWVGGRILTDNTHIRPNCPYKGLNLSLERGCTDETPCLQCRIDRDIEENPELYDALADD